jgi:hypothetical protein
MTYLTILIATLLFIIIPIAAATQARLIHFALGLQGQHFNIQAIFGRVGLWVLSEGENKLVNLFKDAVTCIYCFTHHIALLETIVAYTLLFGPWGLVAILIVPAVALMVQNYLQLKVYSQFYGSEEDTNQNIVNNETNDRSN